MSKVSSRWYIRTVHVEKKISNAFWKGVSFHIDEGRKVSITNVQYLG